VNADEVVEIRNKILEALARGYFHKENKKKAIDATLIKAMVDEVMKAFSGVLVPREIKEIPFGGSTERHTKECLQNNSDDCTCWNESKPKRPVSVERIYKILSDLNWGTSFELDPQECLMEGAEAIFAEINGGNEPAQYVDSFCEKLPDQEMGRRMTDQNDRENENLKLALDILELCKCPHKGDPFTRVLHEDELRFEITKALDAKDKRIDELKQLTHFGYSQVPGLEKKITELESKLSKAVGALEEIKNDPSYCFDHGCKMVSKSALKEIKES
jgi:hypothetical protein